MVRGMVPKEKLLEWSVEDGWEPLCKFLDKPIPDEAFPQTNALRNFNDRSDGLVRKYFARFLGTQFLSNSRAQLAFGGITTGTMMWWQGRIPELTTRLNALVREVTAKLM
ncbi:hypothetical protein N7456_012536 [Penicillium angulare]|uniref:Uncharacterized protein n=1 Tax=Penicillium angulare TaxID=116970 RepID=A0A9W9K134_9EURO|nr:hypothetical protein N7456_012536 [Penicillium angulare]